MKSSVIDLEQYRAMFLTITFIVALFAASPVMSRLLVYPRTEFFTELWLLGPNHKAEGYPYNVSSGAEYTVYLSVGNHLGYCAYYQIMVKFRNESQLGPTKFGPEGTRVPSNVSSLFNLSIFVGDLQTWEEPLKFSFDYTYNNITERVDFNGMTFNDEVIDMSGFMVTRNVNATKFIGNLFFEAWLYQNEALGFVYHERFVNLKLNMTS